MARRDSWGFRTQPLAKDAYFALKNLNQRLGTRDHETVSLLAYLGSAAIETDSGKRALEELAQRAREGTPTEPEKSEALSILMNKESADELSDEDEISDDLINQIVKTKDRRHRLVRWLDDDGNPVMSLHLVYYHAGSPIAFSREPASPFGDTLQRLTEHSDQINDAFKHRPINGTRIPHI